MLHYFKMGSADEPIDLRMPYFSRMGLRENTEESCTCGVKKKNIVPHLPGEGC